jgi:hypothetical protein
LRADWKEESEGFWRRESGRVFQVVGPQTEKERGPRVLSLVRGIRRQRGSEAERRERDGV